MILVQEKIHYENIMHTKVLSEIKNAQAEYQELEGSCQVIGKNNLMIIHL